MRTLLLDLFEILFWSVNPIPAFPSDHHLVVSATDDEVIKVTMEGAAGNASAGAAHGISNMEVKVPTVSSDDMMGHVVHAYPIDGPNVVKFNNNKDGLGRRFQKWVTGTWVDY